MGPDIALEWNKKVMSIVWFNVKADANQSENESTVKWGQASNVSKLFWSSHSCRCYDDHSLNLLSVYVEAFINAKVQLSATDR